MLQPLDPETIARLARLAGRVQQLGRSYGATKVVIACLGDLLRRQSTATEWAHRTSLVSMRRSGCDGTGSASVIRLDNSVQYTSEDIAGAIGRPDLAARIDLDALMVNGDQLLFSIQPLDVFDGGEIWD